MSSRSTLSIDPEKAQNLEPYLPNHASPSAPKKPFVTLTYAQSLESKLSLGPGLRTALSGQESKAMTHYLRTKHDAILVGVGTVIADNPSLNARIEGVGLSGQPRPVVVDPQARWEPVKQAGGYAECLKLAYDGRGKGPWVITSKKRENLRGHYVEAIERCGGKYITVPSADGTLHWDAILNALYAEEIRSVMIEGGGKVINTLLSQENLRLIDSVIITIAPVWLGSEGVSVSPPAVKDESNEATAAGRLVDVKWQQYGQDMVLCGRLR